MCLRLTVRNLCTQYTFIFLIIHYSPLLQEIAQLNKIKEERAQHYEEEIDSHEEAIDDLEDQIRRHKEKIRRHKKKLRDSSNEDSDQRE